MIKNDLSKTELKTSDFNFDLPQELIAQHPCEPRDAARLLVLDRENQTTEHRIFRDIVEYLHPGDVLVINDSKVIPARIYGKNAVKAARLASFCCFARSRSIDGRCLSVPEEG